MQQTTTMTTTTTTTMTTTTTAAATTTNTTTTRTTRTTRTTQRTGSTTATMTRTIQSQQRQDSVPLRSECRIGGRGRASGTLCKRCSKRQQSWATNTCKVAAVGHGKSATWWRTSALEIRTCRGGKKKKKKKQVHGRRAMVVSVRSATIVTAAAARNLHAHNLRRGPRSTRCRCRWSSFQGSPSTGVGAAIAAEIHVNCKRGCVAADRWWDERAGQPPSTRVTTYITRTHGWPRTARVAPFGRSRVDGTLGRS
jgi:hypothetical protein